MADFLSYQKKKGEGGGGGGGGGPAIWAATYSLMGCPSGLSPVNLWATGSSLKDCHKAFQGGCGLYVGLACEPKEIINNLFFYSILLGDLHNFIN